ncbi:uncharacterized protein LOC106083996 isoform X11 [Stomoxys calcitrans]|uniref:uncharacterized protein LOC106083996 isoform X11 n=1 Tax=Stomoxys calcitrans TaxID=35570 RepID=UPI0027E26123|nr:uncharacterized protein LOC106083996 isoform X11 [Stomoxys calcitrans]
MAAMVNMTSLLNGKDSRWLQLEVCREFQRNKCSRQDTECKFAHPPANVEVQNGKVTACYDSIKGRCNRDKPPCKYFHPPQHLKDQLLINGRNHLALKNALMQQMGIAPGQPVIPGQVPAVATNPYLTGIPANTYSPYFAPGHLVPALLGPDPSAVASQLGPVVPQAVQVAQQKIPRSDRLEVCREFVRGACKRAESECRFAHPQDTVARHDDGSITVCMDAVKGRCTRDPCRYFHPPLHLQAQLKAAHSRATAVAAAAATAPVSVSAATLSHHHQQQQHHLHQQQLQHHLQQQQQQTTTTTTTNTLNGSALMATQQQQQQQPHHQQQQQQQTNMANAAAAAAAANAAAVAAMSLGQQHPLEVGKKRAADTDMFQLAYSGMVPIKRPAAEKSGIPVYPGATTYQQLMQLQQPFVPVSSSKKIPINASYVIYTDESGQLLDTLPVCQDFNRSMCSRLNCRFVHLTEDDKVEVCDQRVAVCRDHANGQCRRKQCKYYHIPIVLPPANIMAALINGNHNNSTIISSNNNSSINNNNNNSNITNLNTQHNQLQTTQQQQQQQQHDFEQHILQQQQKVATTCGVMPAVATTIATTNYNNNLIIIEPHHQQSPQQQQQHPHHHQQQQQQQQHFYTPATISYTTQHHPQQATTLATPKVLTSQSSQLFHATPTTHITTVPHIFHTSPHQQQQQQQQQFQQLQYTTANTTAYQGSHPHQQMPQHTIQHQTHHHHPHQHHQTHHHITSPYSPSAASTSSSASSSCSKACSPTLSTTTTHSTTSTATIPTPMAANYLPLAAAAAPLPPSNTTNYLKAPPPPPPNAATAMTLAIATQAPLVLGCSTLSNSSYSTNCIPILTTPPDVSALAGATTLSHHHHHHQTGHATAFIYPATAQPQH